MSKSIDYNYKGYEVCVQKEKTLAGEVEMFYQIYDSNGEEVVCAYTCDTSSLKVFANGLKDVVDDVIENPEEYY